MSLFVRFVRDEDGSTPIEYAMIAALIAVAILAALLSISEHTEAVWNHIRDAFPKEQPAATTP